MSKKTRAEAKKKESQDAEQLFLDELTQLTNKYKIKIGGCGCCGSPYLLPVRHSGRYTYTDQLKYD